MGLGTFFGKLFGTETALNSVIDSVSTGLDKLSYTDQEKAETAASERTEARKMVVDWMTATQGQNLTRRFIALSFTFMFFLLLFSGIGLSVASVWIEEPGKIQLTSEVLFKFLGEIDNTYSLIIAFYFAAPHMSDIAKSYIANKTK